MKRFQTRYSLLSLLALVPFAACDGTSTGTAALPLVAACVTSTADAPQNAWLCGDDRVEECHFASGSHPGVIYAISDDEAFCATVDPTPSESGPFAPGEYTVVVSTGVDEEATPLCLSTLTVVDTAPPEVTTHALELWPPNHKMHTIAPLDCVDVHDACDPNVHVAFTWITSDEPDNTNGDGNTTGDIELIGGNAHLRAERMGGGDGRVYTLGWVAADHVGHHVTGTCRVTVPHDKGGSVANAGEPAEVTLVGGPIEVGGTTVVVSLDGGLPLVEVSLTNP